MSTRNNFMSVCLSAATMLLLPQVCPAARYGGGYGGGGSIRFSGGGGYRAPAAPAIESRPAAPPANMNRPAYNSGVGTTYRPADMGSIATRPAYSAPATGHVVEGPAGGSWGAAQGPAGGMVVGHQNPAGGTGGVVMGPGGAVAGRATGPYGASAAAVRGPEGGAGGVIRGPAGGAAGYVRGPEGAAAAGVRTPYGGAAAVARLPDGSTRVAWHGNDYWHHHGNWYYPYWNNGAIWYWPTYAPVGYFTPTLDCGDSAPQPVTVNGITYYQCADVYYTQTTQDGQSGYIVAENPVPAVAPAAPAATAAASEPNTPDPFACLRNGLDFLAAQQQFNMTVNDVYDEVTANGQKVSYTTRRNIFVRRPGSVAIEYRGGGEDRRIALADGTFTILDRTQNAYSQTPVPPTIDEALDTLASKYGMAVIVGELLHTDLYQRVSGRITTGQYLGQDQVADDLCDHLAFTTATADYEFWFDTGASPMLRRLSIVYKNAPGRPRYTMVVIRFSAAPMPDQAFAVRIPAGASLVPLAPPAAASQPTGQPEQQSLPRAPDTSSELSVP